MAKQRQFMFPPGSCKDPSGDHISVPAPSLPGSNPSICSDLSEYSNGSAVRQAISLDALPNIGKNFLAAYNRIDTWVGILSSKTPEPLQTITTVQSIGRQARIVLTALFSVGCLPNKHREQLCWTHVAGREMNYVSLIQTNSAKSWGPEVISGL